MCRLLFVLSNNNLTIKNIRNLLWFQNHSIFKQCYKEPYTPYDENNPRNHSINLDGYGIGFYVDNIPKKYTNIIPSWNDINLFQIIPYIKTKILMVHIRSVDPLVEDNFKYIGNQSQTPVHVYNCHPFIYDKYMFSHNGFIEAFYKGNLRKKIINNIDDNLLLNIKGNTDSEYLFFLIMTFFKTCNNIIQAVKDTIKFIVELDNSLTFSMNIIITNGIITLGTRYINKHEQNPPSLYYFSSKDKMYISSEPLEKNNYNWILIPKNSIVVFNNNTVQVNSI